MQFILTLSYRSPSFAQVKRGVSTWLHKFAMAAEKALLAEFDLQCITTVEERGSFVRFLLGDVEDISSKQRPFLWKTAYNPCEDTDAPDPDKFQVCYTHGHTCVWSTNQWHVFLRGYSKGIWSRKHFSSISWQRKVSTRILNCPTGQLARSLCPSKQCGISCYISFFLMLIRSFFSGPSRSSLLYGRHF